MLECREITKLYGRKAAVDNVSFKLEPGKIYAMLGPNGSGKTTLMKMAVGLVKPSSGGFLYNGEPVGPKSRREVAYMSTEPYFYNWMTIKDVGQYYNSAIFMKESHLVEMVGVEELREERGKSVVDLYREIYGHGGEATC